MAWSDKQKPLAARACKAAGIDEEQRMLILRQFGNRAVYNGRVTSTSPHLTQVDFERFMSVVEGFSGGQIQIKRRGQYIFKPGHFSKADDGECKRLIYVAQDVAKHVFAGQDWQAQLNGWIDKRVTGGKCRTVEKLTIDQLRSLLAGLRAFAKRREISVPAPGATSPRRHGLSSSSMQGRKDAHKPLTNADIPF